MITSPKDPFAKAEPKLPNVGSFRESSLELADGLEVRELGDGDTVPAELLTILESQKTPKR